MDFLKAEIASKRKTLDAATDARPSKYMRRGDLNKLKAEEGRNATASPASEGSSRTPANQPAALKSPPRSATNSPAPFATSSETATSSSAPVEAAFNISVEETIRRLRSKGQPIRLFGESDKERRLRLRALELIEERDHERHGGQNDFKKALEEVESREREMKAHAQNGEAKGKKKAGVDSTAGTEILDLSLLKTDKSKLYPIIYHALKRILKEWEHAMDGRPDHVKATTQGKLAAATQQQSAEYLKPLFKTLKQKNLPDDMLVRISEIVHFTQKRQYQRANDAYLRLSIGNAPWPIGVTMVGIHERSAREKISADQVAHVLNDEVSRKYIQSLKRLITFSQSAHPPEDPSQLMG